MLLNGLKVITKGLQSLMLYSYELKILCEIITENILCQNLM